MWALCICSMHILLVINTSRPCPHPFLLSCLYVYKANRFLFEQFGSTAPETLSTLCSNSAVLVCYNWEGKPPRCAIIRNISKVSGEELRTGVLPNLLLYFECATETPRSCQNYFPTCGGASKGSCGFHFY